MSKQELLFSSLVLTSVFLCPNSAQAQQATVTLQVDRHIVFVGEPVQVTVSILVEGETSYDEYRPPTFTGFQVSSGGMRTQNVEVINWRVRRRESYSYQIVPTKEGRHVVGPASIQIGGKTIKSSTITLDVKATTSSSGGIPPSPDQETTETTPTTAPNRPIPSVFLHAVASPQKAYIGQQILAVWRLFTQSDVLGFQTIKQPTTDDFWSEDLQSPRQLEFERKIIQGRVYATAVLGKKALFPQRIGKLTIGPIRAQVRTWDNFSSPSQAQTSDSVIIDVIPLPTEKQPSGFPEQNVGQFVFSTSLDRSLVNAGDAVTLKAVVRGNGNIRQFKMPSLPQIDGLKIYEPKISEHMDLKDSAKGEKIVEYLLLPTRSGQIRLPALHIDFFDPVENRYRRSSSESIVLEVRGKIPAEQSSNPRQAKKNVLGPDIRPPRSAQRLEHRGRSSLFNGTILVLFVLPVAILVFLGGIERIRMRLRRETDKSISRAISRQIRKHLLQATEFKKKGDAKGFFGELTSSINAQLYLRMKTRVEGLTRKELQQKMEAVGFPGELVRETIDQLSNYDFGRFAMAAAETKQLDLSLRQTRRLLPLIERSQLKLDKPS
ncbi:MAG: BatD family protein [Pseudomonadota bacterium]